MMPSGTSIFCGRARTRRGRRNRSPATSSSRSSWCRGVDPLAQVLPSKDGCTVAVIAFLQAQAPFLPVAHVARREVERARCVGHAAKNIGEYPPLLILRECLGLPVTGAERDVMQVLGGLLHFPIRGVGQLAPLPEVIPYIRRSCVIGAQHHAVAQS